MFSESVMAHGTNSINYITPSTPAPVGGTNSGTAGGGATVAYGFKRLVGTCSITLTNNGSALSTATIPHNLGYVPRVEGALLNATVTIATGSIPGVTIPLPIFDSASVTGGSPIGMTTYLYCFADINNVYVNLLNTTGNPYTVTPTVYLYQT